jgi:misacylated tRNA(Ala) deacylase
MSVKPPMDGGWVRTIRIGRDVDYQPCGGTHVANTREIGAVTVGKVESKGKQNRRINVHLAA